MVRNAVSAMVFGDTGQCGMFPDGCAGRICDPMDDAK